jgi:hypothetical protein
VPYLHGSVITAVDSFPINCKLEQDSVVNELLASCISSNFRKWSDCSEFVLQEYFCDDNFAIKLRWRNVLD